MSTKNFHHAVIIGSKSSLKIVTKFVNVGPSFSPMSVDRVEINGITLSRMCLLESWLDP